MPALETGAHPQIRSHEALRGRLSAPQVLWLLPAYAICIVINMLWFNDLSKSAFAFRAAEGAPKAAGASDSGGRDGAAAARANAAPAAKKG